jgi:hypothetical protein
MAGDGRVVVSAAATSSAVRGLPSHNAGAADGNGDGNDGNRVQLLAHAQHRRPRRMLRELGRPYSL